MNRTDTFATEDERRELKAMVDAPAIAIHCGPRPNVAERAHELALAHGLPEIPGRYGLDLETGEFLTA